MTKRDALTPAQVKRVWMAFEAIYVELEKLPPKLRRRALAAVVAFYEDPSDA